MRFDPATVTPLIGGPYRRSCEENLARTAWSSAKLRDKPASVQLLTLLHYPGLNARPVYARQARKALASGCAAKQAVALEDLQTEIERLRGNGRQVRKYAPNLLALAA